MPDQDLEQIDRAIEQAAYRISRELETMIGNLPTGAAPQMAIERLAASLVEKQPELVKCLGLEGFPIAEILADFEKKKKEAATKVEARAGV